MKGKIKAIIKAVPPEIFFGVILASSIGLLQLHQDSLLREIEDKKFKVLANATQMSSANASYAGFYSEIGYISQAVQQCRGNTGKDCEIARATLNRKVDEWFPIEQAIWVSYGSLEDSFKEYNDISSKNNPKIFITDKIIQSFIFLIIINGLYIAWRRRREFSKNITQDTKLINKRPIKSNKNMNTKLLRFILVLVVIVGLIFFLIFKFVPDPQTPEKTTVAVTLFASFIALIFGFLALIKDVILNLVFRPELQVGVRESSTSEPYTILYLDEHKPVCHLIRCAKSFGLRVKNKSLFPAKNIKAKIREKKEKEVNWLNLEMQDDISRKTHIQNLSRHEDEWFKLGYKSKDQCGGDFYLAVAPYPYASRNNQSTKIPNLKIGKYDLVVVAENTRPMFFNIEINNNNNESNFDESNIKLVPRHGK